MNTDRFNHNFDRKLKTEDTRMQRVGVTTGIEHCPEWTNEKKLAISASSKREDCLGERTRA